VRERANRAERIGGLAMLAFHRANRVFDRAERAAERAARVLLLRDEHATLEVSACRT
jgi:hypothetical protein